ncbi:MAG: hypothetical protein NVS9B3_10650 [Gemmatimonadaceae bacterium]
MTRGAVWLTSRPGARIEPHLAPRHQFADPIERQTDIPVGLDRSMIERVAPLAYSEGGQRDIGGKDTTAEVAGAG